MKKNYSKIISISILIFIVIIFALSIVFFKEIKLTMNQTIMNYGLFFLLILSLILEAVPQYISPQILTVNSLLIGFPFWKTILFLYLGSVIGSIIGFEAGIHFRKKLLATFFKEEKIEKIKKFTTKHGNLAVLLSSIFPVLPYIPMAFGALHIKRINFIIYGIAPRFIYFLYVALIVRWVI